MSNIPILSPSDASSLLQIKESTLRKYSLLLENVGYKFQRNNQNQRWYNDTDIVALKKFISLKNSTVMNLKDCAQAVLMWSNGKNITQPLTVLNNDTERHNDDVTELKKLVNNQNELIKELLSRMDQQQKYIDERLNSRDTLLMQSIKESQDANKLLLESKTEQEQKEQQRDNLNNENLKRMNEELIKKLDDQQKYIDERLEQRDRKLIESLRESQEERKALLQLAAAQEEEKKKRRGIFKFFSK